MNNNFDADEIIDHMMEFNTSVINKCGEVRSNKNRIVVEGFILSYLLTELEIITKKEIPDKTKNIILFQLGIAAGQLGIEDFYQKYGDRIIRLLQSEDTEESG